MDYSIDITSVINGDVVIARNLKCLSPLVIFRGKRKVESLHHTITTNLDYFQFKNYFTWVTEDSVFSEAFKNADIVDNFVSNKPNEVKVSMNVKDYNLNYVLGSLIVLRHAFEIDDWPWKSKNTLLRTNPKQNPAPYFAVFNACILSPVKDVPNHMVFDKNNLLTADKISNIKERRKLGPKLPEGYSMEDIEIKKFFNGDT